ncbi:hypothetical protein SAMN05446934_1274 [Paraburkholderia hospita]|nr:hypothetical protein SAMN05446934_1274 [Paraburkholderia hospita]
MCLPYAQIAAVRTSATTPKPIVILRLWSITNDCRFSLSWQSDNCCERNYALPRTQTTVPSTLTHVPHPTTQISTLIVASAASGTARRWSFCLHDAQLHTVEFLDSALATAVSSSGLSGTRSSRDMPHRANERPSDLPIRTSRNRARAMSCPTPAQAVALIGPCVRSIPCSPAIEPGASRLSTRRRWTTSRASGR